MTFEEHKALHLALYLSLDELVADWRRHTRATSLGEHSIMELVEWSYQQTQNPTELVDD